jgi:hypothetical protein
VQEQGAGRPSGTVLIRARHSGTVVCVVLTIVWAVALAASLSAQPTASGKIGAGAFFGVFIVATVGLWLAVNRRRSELEVSHDTVALRKGTASYPLHRAFSDSLRILPPLRARGVVRPARLTSPGSGGILSLAGFPPDKVRSACEAHGWRFDGATDLAVSDVQRWLEHGRSAEAAQLIDLFGPFTAVAADSDADTALEAAVFEDYGDKIIRTARSAARDAYRRAARAQRAFAGYAPSPGEGAARLGQADRIDGKARD